MNPDLKFQKVITFQCVKCKMSFPTWFDARDHVCHGPRVVDCPYCEYGYAYNPEDIDDRPAEFDTDGELISEGTGCLRCRKCGSLF